MDTNNEHCKFILKFGVRKSHTKSHSAKNYMPSWFNRKDPLSVYNNVLPVLKRFLAHNMLELHQAFEITIPWIRLRKQSLSISSSSGEVITKLTQNWTLGEQRLKTPPSRTKYQTNKEENTSTLLEFWVKMVERYNQLIDRIGTDFRIHTSATS